MAKFKSRHQRSRHRLFSGPLRLILVIAFIFIMAVFLLPDLSALLNMSTEFDGDSAMERYYLPAESQYPIYHRGHYSLAYAEEHEQPAWVAYELTIEQLNSPNKVKRSDYFKDDFDIRSGSAQFADYKGSGLTKGHMVPAADRNYSIEAMEETFLMSNMSPQYYHCNAGIWRELEEQTRDWARSNRSLFIVSGPIFKGSTGHIGRNRVTIPKAYFKAILDLEDPDQKAIAFIIPNEKSDRHLRSYAGSIDDVEAVVGLDLFHELMPDKLEAQIESSVDVEAWHFDESRFQRRVTKWNR